MTAGAASGSHWRQLAIGALDLPATALPELRERLGAAPFRAEGVEAYAGETNGKAVLWLLAGAADASEADRRAAAVRAATEEVARRHEPSRVVSCRARLASERPPGDVLAAAPWVLPMAMPAPPDELPELERWYEEEHTGLLLACPAWLQVARYLVDEVSGAAWSHIAFHSVREPGIFGIRAVQASMETPWRMALSRRDWFRVEDRPVLERLGAR